VTLRGELRDTARLALPLCITHLGQQLMGLVDSAMLGHYSSEALGGGGIANGILFTVTVLGIGTVMGLDTLVPQALGAGEPTRARRLFDSGIRLCVIIGVPLTAIAAVSMLALDLLGVDPDVAHEARIYILGRLPAIIPMLLFAAQRSYLQALDVTRPLVIAIVAGNVVNVIADYVLIFGDPGLVDLGLPALGIPATGVIGASIATTVVSVLSMAIAGLAIRRLSERPARPTLVRPILRLGLPVGLHLLAEVGVFAISAMLAGNLGKTPAAAHQVAITLASFSFSMAIGVGAATAVRVGRAIGRADPVATKRAGFGGMVVGASLMGASAIVFLVTPEALASLLSSDPEVIAASVPLIRIAAVFQLSDAIQAVAAGALRGAGDTRFTFLTNLVGHYAVSLPVSLVLAFALGMGAPGLWWGLCTGLTCVAVVLTVRFFRLARNPIARS
jgi:MATE family multidrug resistance protein